MIVAVNNKLVANAVDLQSAIDAYVGSWKRVTTHLIHMLAILLTHRLQVGDTVDVKVRRNAGLPNEQEVMLNIKLE